MDTTHRKLEQVYQWTQYVKLYNDKKGFYKTNHRKMPYFGTKTEQNIPLIAETVQADPNLLKKLYQDAIKSRDSVVRQYIPFAKKVLSHFRRRYICNVPIAVLENAALLGLTKAVEGFEPHKGYKLISYAHAKIWREMQIVLEKEAYIIDVPRHVQQCLHQSKQGNTPKQVKATAAASQARKVTSLETRINHGETEIGNIADLKPLWQEELSPGEQLEREERITMIRTLLKRLPEPEQELIKQVYGLENGQPMSLRAYASQSNTNYTDVVKQHRQTLRKLKAMSQELEVNSF